MTNPRHKTACIALVGWLLSGCGDGPEPQKNIPPTPTTAVEKTIVENDEEKLIDSLGRLVPGTEKVDGYPIPKLASEETEPGAPSRSFRARALQRSLLEFYMHRDFHVVKLNKGHRIQHSSITRERNGKDDEGFGTLFITQRKQRDQHLRFIPAKAPIVHVPEVNREVLEEQRNIWTKEEQQKVEAILEEKPRRKVRNKKRIIVPFNPGVPRSVGTRSTQGQVKDWLKKNPGTVFYD